MEKIPGRAPQARYFGKIYRYPCGMQDIIASTSPDFKPAFVEDGEKWQTRPGCNADKHKPLARETDVERSMRRARARVRRLALANEMTWFVTLTLNREKVNRYDSSEVVRKLNQWCSNQVKRKGLKYILVPERHKDGAIHFHGFFNDALEAVPSGHNDSHGHSIYNLPGWSLGFTAAIRVYGDYAGAVSYVCKYIGKQGEKPAGRWYYSGGELVEPCIEYVDIDVNELEEIYGEKCFVVDVPGRKIAICNGITSEG